MTDGRIARVVDRMHAEASTLHTRSVRRTRIALGDRSVELVTPHHVNASGIPIEGAFLERRDEGAPPFRLTVLDDTVAGPPPPFTWPSDWNAPFGAVQPHHSHPHRFAFDIHSRSFSTFDPRSGDAVVWFHDVARIPYWVAATPFRLQLSWMADTFDAEMLHAAGVRFPEGAALIVGASGAGKSTLALASALAGHSLLGDDFLLLERTRAHPVYRRTKAHPDGLGLQGGGALRLGTVLNASSAGEKRIIDTDPGLLSDTGCRVCAVFVPRIGRSPGIRALPVSVATRRALGPSMQGLLGGSLATLGRITRLMGSVPAYEITVGPDLADNVRLLEQTARAADSKAVAR